MIEMKEFARGLGYIIRENDWIDHRKFTARYPSSTIYSEFSSSKMERL